MGLRDAGFTEHSGPGSTEDSGDLRRNHAHRNLGSVSAFGIPLRSSPFAFAQGRQGTFASLSASKQGTFAALPSAPLGTGSASRRGRQGRSCGDGGALRADGAELELAGRSGLLPVESGHIAS